MTRALVALVALALALPAPSLAQAPPTNAPPGNAAIDEYLETVPGATGDTRPPQSAPNGASGAAAERARRSGAGAGADGSGLSDVERTRLERAGADGRTLADAVEATAPAKAASNRASGELEAGGRSPLGEVLGTVSGGDRGGGGMGVALPAILLGALLAALVLVLLRRRAAA